MQSQILVQINDLAELVVGDFIPKFISAMKFFEFPAPLVPHGQGQINSFMINKNDHNFVVE